MAKLEESSGRIYLENGDVLVNNAGQEIKYKVGKPLGLTGDDCDFRFKSEDGKLLEVYYDMDEASPNINKAWTRADFTRRKGITTKHVFKGKKQ